MTPTLNVNLQCVRHEEGKIGGGVPVLIPCPLPPEVEFTVRLGECRCGAGERTSDGRLKYPFTAAQGHDDDCPARPIRVTCTIGGEKWEGSNVDLLSVEPSDPMADRVRCMAACRERWALVKALVLGHTAWDYTMSGAAAVPLATITAMLSQRDAVFAALCDMVRSEQAAIAAQAECDTAFPIDTYVKVPAPDHRVEPRPSAVRLAAFVAHLIATVGALT